LRLRGFDFVAAAMAFFDEFGVTLSNASFDEERFERLAYVPDLGMITVIFSVRKYEGEESYLIISAREATKTEISIYERGY
jgi:uncharacterized DUF497 family protein